MQDLLIILMFICGILAILAFFEFAKTVLEYSEYQNSKHKNPSKCKHMFDSDEVINLRIDPKCTKCGTPLSQAV